MRLSAVLEFDESGRIRGILLNAPDDATQEKLKEEIVKLIRPERKGLIERALGFCR